jgi:hypothetical protein
MHPDLEPWQVESILYGGQCAGEYLESIHITDLAKLSPNQWETLLYVITSNYHTKHNELKPCPF